MTEPFRVACVQTNSGREIAENLVAVGKLLSRAAADGARLIITPENVAMMEPDSRRLREKAVAEAEHPALAAFREEAARLGTWVVVGSLAVKRADGRIANRCYLLDDAGAIVASYDKIHLFDVELGAGESYRESQTFAAGDRAVVAATPWGALGLSVCYDLRFPHLYRALAKAGALFLTCPAAFTRVTGRAHWHVLLRARAIETGCYVLAAAQCGVHAQGRETFGHSLIVDPWGEVIADGGDDIGMIIADIDPAKVVESRQRLPSLSHDRPFSATVGEAPTASVGPRRAFRDGESDPSPPRDRRGVVS